MATNFDFLKNTDVNLYDIISDAEKLYRDEYFEQCITQTRRFAENVCKNVLGKSWFPILLDTSQRDENERCDKDACRQKNSMKSWKTAR